MPGIEPAVEIGMVVAGEVPPDEVAVDVTGGDELVAELVDDENLVVEEELAVEEALSEGTSRQPAATIVATAAKTTARMLLPIETGWKGFASLSY